MQCTILIFKIYSSDFVLFALTFQGAEDLTQVLNSMKEPGSEKSTHFYSQYKILCYTLVLDELYPCGAGRSNPSRAGLKSVHDVNTASAPASL